MGKRTQIKKHLHALDEVQSIMSAMKNLSLIELKKLGQAIPTQEQSSTVLEEVISDFLSFYPSSRFFEEKKREKVPYLLVGSERGFCGGFNESLIHHLETFLQSETSTQPALILAGKKLSSKFQEDSRVVQILPSPSNAEEIPRILEEVVRKLTELGNTLPDLRLRFLTIFFNHEENNQTVIKTLRPFARFFQKEPHKFPFPPRINLEPNDLFNRLTDHYLLSKLQEIFYLSLLSEQKQRLQHVEGALRFLDKEISRLTLRMNELRQEEITEEIEVILLGTGVVSES